MYSKNTRAYSTCNLWRVRHYPILLTLSITCHQTSQRSILKWYYAVSLIILSPIYLSISRLGTFHPSGIQLSRVALATLHPMKSTTTEPTECIPKYSPYAPHQSTYLSGNQPRIPACGWRGDPCKFQLPGTEHLTANGHTWY